MTFKNMLQIIKTMKRKTKRINWDYRELYWTNQDCKGSIVPKQGESVKHKTAHDDAVIMGT